MDAVPEKPEDGRVGRAGEMDYTVVDGHDQPRPTDRAYDLRQSHTATQVLGAGHDDCPFRIGTRPILALLLRLGSNQPDRDFAFAYVLHESDPMLDGPELLRLAGDE